MAITDLAAYPARFFSRLYLDGILLLVYIFVWLALFQDKTEVKGYTVASILTYYAVALLTRKLTSTKSITRRISSHIRDGTLSIFLLQPMDFTAHYFFRLLTKTLFQSVVPITLLVLITQIYKNFLVKPQNLDLFILSIFLAGTISYLFYAILGSIAFWTTSVWGVNSIIGRAIQLVSGMTIPLDFYPEIIRNISQYLPFQYTVFTPVSIYIGKYTRSDGIAQIGIQILWVGALLAIQRVVWHFAIKKYDSVGN